MIIVRIYVNAFKYEKSFIGSVNIKYSRPIFMRSFRQKELTKLLKLFSFRIVKNVMKRSLKLFDAFYTQVILQLLLVITFTTVFLMIL